MVSIGDGFLFSIFHYTIFTTMFSILLYYKYVFVADPERLKIDQLNLCRKLDLKGRIIVSKEGINGTVEGTKQATATYIAEMKKDSRFADIDFKESEGDGASFPRLSVKNRPEIVTLGTGTSDGNFKTGAYISPDELQKWFDEKKDFVVIDMRNDYEHVVGHFENSILFPVDSFKEIPKQVENLSHLKDKTIVNVCTGGVRCEKASSYLMEKGFKNVHQLEGGMVRYLEKHPGKKFKGSLYVFDKRVVVNYDSPEQHVVIGKCKHCNTPSEKCENCSNLDCHKHLICCEECNEKFGLFCSEQCRKIVEAKTVAVK